VCQVRGLLPYPGDRFDRLGREEGLFRAALHLQLAVGLGLVGGHLAHRLVDREAEAVGQPRFLADALAQFRGELHGPEEFLGAREVHVEFIHAAFLEQWNLLADDLGDLVALLHVGPAVAAQDDRLGAQLLGHAHGHGTADAQGPRLVAATGHHAAIAVGADEHRPAFQLRMLEHLHAHEEAVQIQVEDVAVHDERMIAIDDFRVDPLADKVECLALTSTLPTTSRWMTGPAR